MSKEREKVKCKTELEFITEVADDCVANLKDKDREHLIRNPYAIDYHFSYFLYISTNFLKTFSSSTRFNPFSFALPTSLIGCRKTDLTPNSLAKRKYSSNSPYSSSVTIGESATCIPRSTHFLIPFIVLSYVFSPEFFHALLYLHHPVKFALKDFQFLLIDSQYYHLSEYH